MNGAGHVRLGTVSSDQERGAPSFGDLFDDPDSPESPALPAQADPTSVPLASTDVPAALPDELHDDLVTGHDLDHESDEASHLVAGFEHAGDDDTADEPATGYDSVMIAPLSGIDADHPDGAADMRPAGGTASPANSPDAVQVPAAAGVLAAAQATRRGAGESWDGVVDPAVSSAPATRVDTGRLYRSSGAEGPATLDAIPAIDPSYSPAHRVEAVAEPVAAGTTGGLTYTGVAVVVIATTVVVAFVEALLRKEIGVLTGVALLASSVYAALVVRRVDIWAAVVIPPLAFLVATLTAGQITQTRTGHFFIDQGSLLLLVLGRNALWVLGTTLVCLAIVLVRRRRT